MHHPQPDGELPEVGADYLGPDGKQATLLVLKYRRTGGLAATQVPAKSAHPYARSFTVGWLRGLASSSRVTTSALYSHFCAQQLTLVGAQVAEQASPEGDSQANSLAEVGVREVKAQAR
eukprot:1463379-Amphidinium_carterae.1